MSEQLVEHREKLAEGPTTGSPKEGRAAHDRGLLLIGIFKLSKCIFFFLMSLGARHLLHAELGNEAMHLAQTLHFDPEWRVVSMAIEKVDLIDAKRLREIGFLSFGYSALSLVEGTGLMLEKVWAEYLTLGLTIMFLPWELYELVRDPAWGRLALLLANLLVLTYLVWLLQRKKRAATLLQPA